MFCLRVFQKQCTSMCEIVTQWAWGNSNILLPSLMKQFLKLPWNRLLSCLLHHSLEQCALSTACSNSVKCNFATAMSFPLNYRQGAKRPRDTFYKCSALCSPSQKLCAWDRCAARCIRSSSSVVADVTTSERHILRGTFMSELISLIHWIHCPAPNMDIHSQRSSHQSPSEKMPTSEPGKCGHFDVPVCWEVLQAPGTNCAAVKGHFDMMGPVFSWVGAVALCDCCQCIVVWVFPCACHMIHSRFAQWHNGKKGEMYARMKKAFAALVSCERNTWIIYLDSIHLSR